MRTIEVKLYEFNQLSDEAKRVAIEDARNLRWGYDWAHEAFSSLNAFLGALGTRALDYSIDWKNIHQSYVKVEECEIDTDFEFDSGYSLTGYCMDYPLIETWNKTKDVDEAIEAWLRDCANDYEYQISDEGIAEFIMDNEYEFTENGDIYDYI